MSLMYFATDSREPLYLLKEGFPVYLNYLGSTPEIALDRRKEILGALGPRVGAVPLELERVP